MYAKGNILTAGMRFHFVVWVFLMVFNQPAMSQIGTRSVNVFDDETKQNMRAKSNADEKREQLAAQTIAQDRKRLEEAKRAFADEREFERRRVASIPVDAGDKNSQLDLFACMYPEAAVLAPNPAIVDECVKRRLLERETERQQAALDEEQRIRDKLEKERLQLEEQNRIADEEAKKAAIEREQRKRDRYDLLGSIVGIIGLIGFLVVAVFRRDKGWINVGGAILAGCLSGVLLYMMVALIFISKTQELSRLFVTLVFMPCAILSMYLLLVGNVTFSGLLKRSFALGAVEWLAFIPVGLFFTGKQTAEVVSSGPDSLAYGAGAAIGGGLFAFIGSGFSLAMIVLCLIGYGVVTIASRESRNIQGKKKCPECAEFIQMDARKCRYCGAGFE